MCVFVAALTCQLWHIVLMTHMSSMFSCVCVYGAHSGMRFEFTSDLSVEGGGFVAAWSLAPQGGSADNIALMPSPMASGGSEMGCDGVVIVTDDEALTSGVYMPQMHTCAASVACVPCIYMLVNQVCRVGWWW